VSAQSRKILVYDPDPAGCDLLVAALSGTGHAVVATGEPREAVSKTEADDLDLAVVFVGETDLDGAEIIARLKQRDDYMPVLVVSEPDTDFEAIQGYLLSFDGYAEKPVSESAIQQQVRALLRTKANVERLAAGGSEGLLTTTESLSGVYNRKFLTGRFQEEYDRTQQSEQPLSAMVVDLDHFKYVNQRKGYACGNRVLTAVTAFLRSQVRVQDTVCRYGGEEFVIIMPNMDGVRAAVLADRIRRGIEDHDFEAEGAAAVRLTASVGVGERSEQDTGPDDLLLLVDRAAHIAKREGRNRVVLGGR